MIYIYQDHRPSSERIDKNNQRLLYLVLKKFILPENQSDSITEYIEFLREQREELVSLFGLFMNETHSKNTLAMLLDQINKGDLSEKEIALYILCQLATEIKYMTEIHSSMLQVISTSIIPLMKDISNCNKGQNIINARVCEIIRCY